MLRILPYLSGECVFLVTWVGCFLLKDSCFTVWTYSKMLQLLGSVIGLLLIIVCFTRGLKEQARVKKVNTTESSASKMKDLNEEDVHLLAKILSMGLVDADPNYLQHLKGYRDLKNA